MLYNNMDSTFRIDPDSPVPLYHQIAEVIRGRILAGELAAGEVLQPLREAAERWGVNLHTVRHAYASLAREGLLEIGRGGAGTRVAGGVALRPGAVGGARPSGMEEFLTDVLLEAGRRFGWGAEALAERILRRADEDTGGDPVVHVVECSHHQSAGHAAEIAARYVVDARPWTLRQGEPPEPGRIVATYFHYNDIRRLWPRRLHGVAFITIRPEPALRMRLQGRGGAIQVCERDEVTAEAVIGDLEALLADLNLEFVPLVLRQPAGALKRADASLVLFPPRIWADLPERVRGDERAVEIVYRLDVPELDALGLSAGWAGRSLPRAS